MSRYCLNIYFPYLYDLDINMLIKFKKNGLPGSQQSNALKYMEYISIEYLLDQENQITAIL